MLTTALKRMIVRQPIAKIQVSPRGQQRWRKGKRLFMPILEVSFYRNPWSISARNLSTPPPTSEGLLPFKATPKLFPIHPSFFPYPRSLKNSPKPTGQKKGRDFFPSLEVCVMFSCILGSVVPTIHHLHGSKSKIYR